MAVWIEIIECGKAKGNFLMQAGALSRIE